MLNAVGTVLDRLQGLLGRRYLVAGAAPVVLFVVLSLPLVWAVQPESAYLFGDFLQLHVVHQILLGLSAALMLAVVSFVLLMANSWWRHVLERGFLPRNAEIARLRKLEQVVEDSRPHVVKYRVALKPSGWADQLAAAREAGAAGRGAGQQLDSDLLDRYRRARRDREANRMIPYKDLEDLYKLLESELRTKDANQFTALDEMHVAFVDDIAPHAQRAAEARFERAKSQIRERFPSDESRITGSELGNITRAGNDYFVQRYGMNLEVFWPAIEIIATADSTRRVTSALDEAQTRLDFSVAMHAMFVAHTAIWLTILTSVGAGWIWILVVAIGGFLGALVFYRLIIWNTYLFQRWVRSAVALYRFDLLKALHLHLPASSGFEQEAWKKLTLLAELGEGNVYFNHP